MTDFFDTFMSHAGSDDPCPDGPHRSPEGPNEDMAQCHRCLVIDFTMRPENEQYGLHADDCSLPRRHQGWCEGGGTGHAPVEIVRGYWGPTTDADVQRAREAHT